MIFVTLWFVFGFLTATIVAPLVLKINNNHIKTPEIMDNQFIIMLFVCGPIFFFIMPCMLFNDLVLKKVKWPRIDIAELINNLWRLK